MKNVFILGLLLLGLLPVSLAQNVEGSMDDRDRIAVMPVVPKQAEDLSATTEQNLISRLQRIATEEGLGATSQASRFMMVVNLDVISKNTTATAPPMVAMDLDLSLMLIDHETDVTFNTVAVSLKGVGRNDTKAIMQALRNLRSDHQDLRTFMAVGKRKIMEYYNAKCDFIIKRAQTLADNQKFEKALHELTTVPEVCRDCYFRAMDESSIIFDRYQDFLCDKNLQAARATWIANQNSQGANAVARYLAALQPNAACFDEAQNLVKEIRDKVRQDEVRDWDFKLKQWDDQVDLRKQAIEASRQVGIAFGEGQPDQVIDLSGTPYRRPIGL
jgi:hypothetical protein